MVHCKTQHLCHFIAYSMAGGWYARETVSTPCSKVMKGMNQTKSSLKRCLAVAVCTPLCLCKARSLYFVCQITAKREGHPWRTHLKLWHTVNFHHFPPPVTEAIKLPSICWGLFKHHTLDFLETSDKYKIMTLRDPLPLVGKSVLIITLQSN